MKFGRIVYTLVFLLLGVCACEKQAETIVPPTAVKGVLDLTHWDFDKNGPVKLTGDF